MNPIEIVLAFLEGMALIASPCILPILPLILSTSVDGGRQRPFGIIVGFILAFSFFALLSRELVVVFQVNLDYIKMGAILLLTFFGVIMLSERLMHQFARLTQGFAHAGTILSRPAQDGFLSGLLIGLLIGLVWTPCAGPILAVALVQIVRQQDSAHAVLLMMAFSLGAGLPMLAISLLGRKFILKLKFMSDHPSAVHKTLGILILAAVAFIASGANASAWFSSEPNVNNSLSDFGAGLSAYPAPAFATSDQWLNTPSNQALTMAGLRGKVVLVDFWTYSCINCLRTLPYMNAWYQKYHDQGLVIVGVHAPEFEFEKNKANVQQAISRYKILYPVALDNNLDTWTNFNNQYWPAHYLINQSGQVVYTHFGEGEYQTTENAIRKLLGLNVSVANKANPSALQSSQTPETYLGYERARAFSSPEDIAVNTSLAYTLPSFIPANHWALSGLWSIQNQRIVAQQAGAKLALNFTAKHVYLVLGNSTAKPINLTLTLNGKAIKESMAKDAPNGIVKVQEHRLYELVNQKEASNSLLEITVAQPGLEAYAFTFG